jgi:enterochelin esterase-like enzyme
MRFRLLIVALLLSVSAIAQTDSPWITPHAGIPHGKVSETSIRDDIYKKTRRIWVYTPAGYDARAKPYPLLVVLDGADNISASTDIPLPVMLDNLIAAKKIPPMIAVMVDNYSGPERIADLGNRADFGHFMADELIPWARKQWNITTDPKRVITTGSSAGGLGAMNLAFFRPDLYGNVLSQSGAFWRGNEGSNDEPYEWLTSQVKAAPKKPINIYMEVGALETRRAVGVGPVFIEAHRRLRDALLARGYVVEYKEIAGAQHEPNHWKNALPDGLIAITKSW